MHRAGLEAMNGVSVPVPDNEFEVTLELEAWLRAPMGLPCSASWLRTTGHQRLRQGCWGNAIFPESVCEGFFVKNICRTTSHLHLHIFTSARLHLCSSSHLRIYSSAHLLHLHIYISAHLHTFTSVHLHLHLHICASHIFTALLFFLS